MFTEYEGSRGWTIAVRAPQTVDFASKAVLTLIPGRAVTACKVHENHGLPLSEPPPDAGRNHLSLNELRRPRRRTHA